MFRTVSARLYILWVCVSFYFVTVFLTGCEPLLAPTGHGSGVGRGGGAGGGGEIVLEIPVRHGRELMCVQGVGGSFSHSDDATRFDIDLDTSNSIDEEVYAPVTGVARVHTESASSGFGYHINIDLGNEVYAVVGHLSDVFISDGEEVAVGQMIGYEGCTGYCTGDHIHVGLHEGAASQTADHGVSIPALYRTSDSSHGGSVEHLDAEDFVCGIKSEGDPQDGHFYESALATNLWHPDGMLVKTPDNAKVYVIEGGKARWIASESVFWSHGYSFSDVVMISSDELACHGTGTNKDETGFVDALFDTEGQLWLLVGINSDPNHYRAPVRGEGWESVMASWGLDYGEGNWPETRGDSSGYFTGWPAVSEPAHFRDGTLVTEESSSAVYVVSSGHALPIKDWETFLLQDYIDHTLLVVEDGVVSAVHGDDVGSCSAGIRCIDHEAITNCGGGLELGGGGEYGGSEESEDDSGSSEEDEKEDEEEDPEEEEEDEEEEESSGGAVSHCSGQDACIADLDSDGTNDTLLMIEDAWYSSSIGGLPAFVYANGGCFDGALTTSDLMYANSDGYYEVDFSRFAFDCTVEMTLINSVGTDGGSPTSGMGNWYWWQNASFCSAGHSLCELQDNGTSWEEWLLSLSWDPTTGLRGNGNGFTSNSQL